MTITPRNSAELRAYAASPDFAARKAALGPKMAAGEIRTVADIAEALDLPEWLAAKAVANIIRADCAAAEDEAALSTMDGRSLAELQAYIATPAFLARRSELARRRSTGEILDAKAVAEILDLPLWFVSHVADTIEAGSIRPQHRGMM